jgi:hypothetical protein
MHSKGVSPFGDLGARSRMSTPSGAHVDALDEQLNQADRLRREQLFSTLGDGPILFTANFPGEN